MRKATRSLLAVVAVVCSASDVRAQSQETPIDCVVRPKATIELGSPEEGILAEISVKRGDIVEQGQEVARLESELQKLALEVARLRAESDLETQIQSARLQFRVMETERADKLHKKNILATKVLDEAEIERRLAGLALEQAKLEHSLAQVELARAKETLERRSLKSPVDGVVAEVRMEPGEYVHEQAPILTIAELDPLHVEAFVPSDYYGAVGLGMRAHVMMQRPIVGLYVAKVTAVDRVFDPASRTFGVRLDLPNPDFGLPAGLTCQLTFLPKQEVKGNHIGEDEDVFLLNVLQPGTE